MIDLSPKMLLYIEPVNPKTEQPVLDELTQKMTAAFTHRTEGIGYQGQFMEGTTSGWQTCVCGAKSDIVDFLLESGYITNSLCIHYLAWHRSDIPQQELDKVSRLPDLYILPTAEQMQ